MDNELEINTFTTIALENALKIYKSQLFHEFYIENIAKLNKMLEKATTNKDKTQIKNAIKETTRKNKENQIRIEKYNSEVTKAYANANAKHITDFLKDFTTDFYSDVTKLLLRACPDKEDNFVIPAVLKEQKNGGLFLKGKEYKIFV